MPHRYSGEESALSQQILRAEVLLDNHFRKLRWNETGDRQPRSGERTQPKALSRGSKWENEAAPGGVRTVLTHTLKSLE